MKKQKGNIGDIMTTGLCILAMCVVLLQFFNCVGLIEQKMKVGQLARKYILKMETMGCLPNTEKILLNRELADMGITDIDIRGSLVEPVGYGEAITLQIKGKLKGEYAFEEKRVSTAKH